MRLDTGVVRELRWQKEADGGYLPRGSVRLTVVDPDRGVWIDDLWFVPAGVLQSIQGLEGGTKFLRVFDSTAKALRAERRSIVP